MPQVKPRDLVAVRLEPGPEWVDVVQDAWARDAAVLPIDHRLPAAEVNALLQRARPTHLVDASGTQRLMGGASAEFGAGVVLASSGSAGAPKLAEIPLAAVRAAVEGSAERLGRGDDHWLCAIPVAHAGGFLIVARTVLLGGRVTVHAGFDPEAFEEEKDATLTSLVPTQVARLLDAGADLARFRAILVGGSALPPPLRERAERSGARLVETYGLTESCGGVVYDGAPLPGVEAALGDEGEIVLAGPTIMRGYRNDAEATARVLGADGRLRTRDAGALEAGGRLRVLGRLDDCIVTGGEKVWPAEVEEALLAHPAVAEVAVAARADEEWGQRVVAFVVPADPASPPALDDLRAHAKERLAAYKAPREVVVCEALPRTALGKVRRAALAGLG